VAQDRRFVADRTQVVNFAEVCLWCIARGM